MLTPTGYQEILETIARLEMQLILETFETKSGRVMRRRKEYKTLLRHCYIVEEMDVGALQGSIKRRAWNGVLSYAARKAAWKEA